ncbi:hypothetical protein WKV44_09320 [Spirochaetia bacterium 38H-sp]|uniref:Uncharacterized protein n=1 Tax=Rarispira pelagica TaxID=3141764 RepID=A0ABU9UDK3_9SPIR
MKKTIIKTVLAGLFISSIAVAQSNEVIDKILNQKAITCGYAAYLILNAGGIISEDTSPDSAWERWLNMGYVKSNKKAQDPISLGEFSFLITKTFDIPGGMMYSLFPSPRYAARELAYLGYIAENPGPYRNLSGKEAISILGRILRGQEDE